MQTMTRPSADPTFSKMVGRLNKLSVEKHFDAYVDIDWDDPQMALDPSDPRLIPGPVDPVCDTDWYSQLDDEAKSRFGLYRMASCMKTGWHFENLLQRGLLAIAFREPNNSEAFRYVHHEVIEESQHTLMFQEYVNRSSLPIRGMSAWYRFLAEQIVERVAKIDRLLFFVFVLGGEDPVDHLQRQLLREGIAHPLLERVMRIHITEEARHLSFARHYLSANVPKAGRCRRAILSIAAPLILGTMVRIMLYPSSDLRRNVLMPRSAYVQMVKSPKGRQLLKDSLAKTRGLWVELGLVGPFSKLLWKAEAIWSD